MSSCTRLFAFSCSSSNVSTCSLWCLILSAVFIAWSSWLQCVVHSFHKKGKSNIFSNLKQTSICGSEAPPPVFRYALSQARWLAAVQVGHVGSSVQLLMCLLNCTQFDNGRIVLTPSRPTRRCSSTDNLQPDVDICMWKHYSLTKSYQHL